MLKLIVTCLCLQSIKSFLFDVGRISSKMCGFNHIFYMKHKLEDCHANLLRNRRQHHVHGDRQGRLCPCKLCLGRRLYEGHLQSYGKWHKKSNFIIYAMVQLWYLTSLSAKLTPAKTCQILLIHWHTTFSLSCQCLCLLNLSIFLELFLSSIQHVSDND